ESMFADFTRLAVRSGADVLVNVTNEESFGRTAAPYQLLGMAVLRAVENHRPLVRVANSGVTAVVTSTGRVNGELPLFTRRSEVQKIEWNSSPTFYTLEGDLFSAL